MLELYYVLRKQPFAGSLVRLNAPKEYKMAISHMARGNWLHQVGNRAVRQAVAALTCSTPFTAFELATASGTATGLNTPNRVRNSATLVGEPNLVVGVVANTTWLVEGHLNVALTAANGIKLDFAAGTAVIQANTMGGAVTFWTAGSNTSATAIGATNAIPFRVALTALNTAVNGGTANTWVGIDFWFVAQVSVTGSIQLEFAQSSAGATNTDILTGSYMTATALEYFTQHA